MSERIVNDPSLHGWVEVDGKWVWDGQSAGSIEDGDTEGQITTWSGAEWTPDSAVVVNTDGDATFSGAVESNSISSQGSVSGESLTLTRGGLKMIFNPNNSGAGTNSFIRAPSGVTFDLGNSDHVNALRIDASGDATFSGTVESPDLKIPATSLSYQETKYNSTVALMVSRAGGGASMQIATEDTGSGTIFFTGNAGNTNQGYIQYNHSTPEMVFGTEGTRSLTIDGSGDAAFSGHVTVSPDGNPTVIGDAGKIWRTTAGACGIKLHTGAQVLPLDESGEFSNGVCNIGGNQYRWKDGYFSGTVEAAGFTVNGVPIGGGGGNVDLTGYATEAWVNNQGFSKTDTTYTSGNGLTLSGTQFKMSGSYTGSFTASGDVTAYSDARLKEDINTLDGSKVFDMRGVSFTKDGKAGSGVIAQELQKIAPELVHDDEQYLSVAYGNLVGYLIESVKMLKAEIEELKRDTA